MNDLKGLRVVVAGAGAIGSVLAIVIARRGAEVLLADPAIAGDNASGVAAGMLAPACEALLDETSARHFSLLKDARDAWDRVLPDLAGALERSGAILQSAAPAAILAKAEAAGMAVEPISEAEARRRAPGLGAAGPFLFTPEDWRLEPQAMLEALHTGLAEAGGVITQADVRDLTPRADVLIQATGPGGDLKPIKGQILRFPGAGPTHGPVVRGEGVYVAPSAWGVIAGATMEEGRSDRDIDPEAVARLAAGARRLFPALEAAEFQARAGVRAATPDGLPLVGPGDGEGALAPQVLVARGARRNGWLLAPLIAEVLLDRLAGRAASATAAAFDPARFRGG
jgi:glycine oxidase